MEATMRRTHALAALALAPFALPLRGGAQAVEHVKLAGPQTEDLTALYYGIKNGLFSRIGLDVEMVGTSSGTAAVTAMIAGTYELAKTSLLSVFNAHLKAIPITIVAPEFTYNARSPFGLLQIATDAPFKSGADLNGKTIGVPALNDLNTLAARAWVDKNGGEWKSLKFVEIPNAVMESALQQHRIDAALMQPPQLDASLAAGTTKTLGDGYGAIAPNFLVGGFVARADWAAKHDDAARKFARGLAQAGAYVNAHQAETLPLVAELTKIPLAATEKMHRSLNATALEPNTVQVLIDATAKYDLIPRTFAAREIIWSS
jgi:NitT/TauT family transport system substrate-binding protein